MSSASSNISPQSGRGSVLYCIAVAVFALPAALMTYFCMHHLDGELALRVRHHLFANRGWSRYASSIPDALLLLVIVTTIVSYTLYRLRLSAARIDHAALMYKMLAITAPVSFAAKSLLKYIFGRITTREWLLAPQDLGFHWFNGGDRYTGFPSGHMVVITALVAIVWRFQPRFRSTYLVLLILLALSLVATNYHFLSDVIVGAYVGLLVEVCIFRIVARSWSIRD